MPKPNNVPHGRIPNSILNQINEHAVGGYVVFYFNQETGEPEQITNFDSPAHYLALQKHITDWTSAVNEAMHAHKVEMFLESLSPPCSGNQEEE